jgi:putative transposase
MVTIRKDKLVNGQYYHIFSRSIAKYVIFNSEIEYLRMFQLIDLIQYIDFPYKFSDFNKLSIDKQIEIKNLMHLQNKSKYVDIVAYCIMPTHFHMILKQNIKNGIAKYIGKILNSYTRFFNLKHRRKGPLWTDRFKNILINNDEQLLHLTRYIHLNPVSANLVNYPENWNYSSYKEYIYRTKKNICNYDRVLIIRSKEYKKFVLDRKDYQKKLSIIKNLIIDSYAG